jgi:hypothetical protein
MYILLGLLGLLHEIRLRDENIRDKCPEVGRNLPAPQVSGALRPLAAQKRLYYDRRRSLTPVGSPNSQTRTSTCRHSAARKMPTGRPQPCPSPSPTRRAQGHGLTFAWSTAEAQQPATTRQRARHDSRSSARERTQATGTRQTCDRIAVSISQR